MRWDIFCRVVDNFGDVGVCWRLARELAARGLQPRLWIDDPSALAWMAPGGAPGVQIGAFDAAGEPGDVVIEAFGCNPPPDFVARMVARPPVWINLEYLSAEDWVERSHRLPSPQPRGLVKWFFFPGFTARTGGLLRERGLLEERDRFDRGAWLGARAIVARRDECIVSLFCYDSAPVPALLQALAERPTLLLLTPGAAHDGIEPSRNLRTIQLPWLPQPEFDRLLWSCDLNFVRGEDSLVRALWAGAPFVWQIYPQADGVHEKKLHALLDRLPPVAGLRALWRAWNGLDPAWPDWPDDRAWHAACTELRTALAAQPDLATQLIRFAGEKASAG